MENADENAVVPADPSGTVREIEIVSQKKAMTEEERNAFLSRFTDENTPDGRSLLALSVMGGVFSEGIDLKGEALIGVAVVGTGIPMVTKERDLMKERLEETGVSGFDYAYRFPGFNKVLQAAGRLIRTPDDKGVILLMDERFLYRENKALFPREWADYRVTDLKNVGWEIESFWESGRSVETND